MERIFSLLSVRIQLLSQLLPRIVHHWYIKTECTVCSNSICQSPGLQLITHPISVLHFLNTYTCCFVKLYFRMTVIICSQQQISLVQIKLKGLTHTSILLFGHKPWFITLAAIFFSAICVLSCCSKSYIKHGFMQKWWYGHRRALINGGKP